MVTRIMQRHVLGVGCRCMMRNIWHNTVSAINGNKKEL